MVKSVVKQFCPETFKLNRTFVFQVAQSLGKREGIGICLILRNNWWEETLFSFTRLWNSSERAPLKEVLGGQYK